jgi:hypothetical protein
MDLLDFDQSTPVVQTAQPDLLIQAKAPVNNVNLLDDLFSSGPA